MNKVQTVNDSDLVVMPVVTISGQSDKESKQRGTQGNDEIKE